MTMGVDLAYDVWRMEKENQELRDTVLALEQQVDDLKEELLAMYQSVSNVENYRMKLNGGN